MNTDNRIYDMLHNRYEIAIRELKRRETEILELKDLLKNAEPTGETYKDIQSRSNWKKRRAELLELPEEPSEDQENQGDQEDQVEGDGEPSDEGADSEWLTSAGYGNDEDYGEF